MKKKSLPEYFDTMKQAASALELPLKILKKAKGAGCPAFRGSRVYREPLQEWLKENKEQIVASRSKEDVQIEKLLEEVRKLRISNDQKEKLVILKDKVKACNAACVDRVRTILEQKLENEYPSAVSQMDVPQARVYGRRLGDQILLEFQKLSSEWDKI